MQGTQFLHSLSKGDVLVEVGTSEKPTGGVLAVKEDGAVIVDWEDVDGDVRHSENKIASALASGGIEREDGAGKELTNWSP